MRPRWAALGAFVLLILSVYQCGEDPVATENQEPVLVVARSLVFVLDLSGSMDDAAGDGRTRLEAAKAALAQVLARAPTNGSQEYALTTFGGGCDVEMPIDFTGFTDDPQRVVDYSAGLSADGSTPLAASLQRGQHLALGEASSEDILLVLLSDGEETCSGGPVEGAAKAHTATGTLAKVISVNAIGFGVTPGSSADQQIQAIAKEAGGNYFRASETADLAAALGQASGLAQTRVPTLSGRVADAEGNPIQGALVQLRTMRENTDANGRYLFPNNAGVQGVDSLIVTADGYVRFGAEVYLFDVDKEFDVELMFDAPVAEIPVAAARVELGVVEPGEQVTLRGNESSDPAGGRLTYHWSQLSGNPFPVSFSDNDSEDAFLVRATLTDLGVYQFVLEVENEAGLRSMPDTVAVEVMALPVAVARVESGVVEPGEQVTLRGNESSDPAGGRLTYHWSQLPGNPFPVSFSDNDSEDAFLVRATLTDLGVYQFVLEVENEAGLRSMPDTVAVEVMALPVAVARVESGVVEPGEQVTLRGNESSDPAGGRLTYHWSQLPGNPFPVSFSDNDSEDAFLVRATLTDLGVYQFVLEVENEAGLRSMPDTVAVEVMALPVAVARVESGVVEPGEQVTLRGNESSDPAGGRLTYHWSQLPGNPFPVSFSDNDSEDAFLVRATLTDLGVYQFVLEVENEAGLRSMPDTVAVEVMEGVFEIFEGVLMEFVWIKPGVFQMGSSSSESGRSSDEGPVHEVEISRGFWLGKYEVTQGQWEAVMGTRPWSGRGYVESDPSHPAVSISWNDVQSFISRLSDAAGDSLYRLPSEAEWEYACRAGSRTRWSFGDDESQLTDYAWYSASAWDVGEEYAHAVGTKWPNAWGLYDMHGNVYEWVEDWYGADYYDVSPRVDPPGPSSGSYRVGRGGAFDNAAWAVRSADRSGFSPGLRGDDVGVRLLRIYNP